MPTRRSVKGMRKATPPAQKTPITPTAPVQAPRENGAGEGGVGEREHVPAQKEETTTQEAPAKATTRKTAVQKENARKNAKASAKVTAKASHKRKRVSPVRVIVASLCVVLVAALGVCTWFALDRWCFHDDALDIQGTWFIYNTQVSIPITENTMGISDDAVYEYTIDTQAKTVTYSIGNLSGTSHYRFSPDRTQIALIEDGKRVFTSTLFDDVSWWTSHIGDVILGTDVLPGPVQSNVVLLTRQPRSDETESAHTNSSSETGANTEANESAEAEASESDEANESAEASTANTTREANA